MALTNNQAVLSWIDEMAKMTQPDQIVWIDGSQEQIDALRAEACSTGELEKLNQELLPDCYLHRTAVNDVARVEDRTFICCEKKENAGPTNNWMDPKEMHEKLNKLYTGAMKGRTMYVIPYSMGVVGSPFAKYGIELTDSIYVVLNMCIMTRVGANVAALLDETFVKGLHAKADIDPEKPLHCPVPRGEHHHVRQLRLRRKRAAGQEVLRPAYRLLPGPQAGLDGRAHADPGPGESPGRGPLPGRRLPLRLRQDQPGHAHSSRRLP